MKIAVLVSGGVDSSVALMLLTKAGHDVTAFYLKIWLEDEVQHLGDCAWEEDLQYIDHTCQQLNVPLRVLSLQREYWDTVVADTLSEVQKGNTPNPDIWCNERIKFGSFFQKIPDDFTKVATGHYAQVLSKKEGVFLQQAPDPVKDQTYFLSRLSQDQLSRILFPIGHLTKTELRHLAQQHNLPAQHRPDSQGICFLGKFRFSDFLREHLGEQKGNIRDSESNQILGTHTGFWFYTIGQRQGLGLSGGPWYVTRKNIETNEIFVSSSFSHEGITTLCIRDFNAIPVRPPDGKYLVKLRHGASFSSAMITSQADGTLQIVLDTPQKGLALGQSVAVYADGFCLGSGIIFRCFS